MDTVMVLVIAGVVIICLVLLYVFKKRCPKKANKQQPPVVASAYRYDDGEAGVTAENRSTRYPDVQKMTLNNSFVPHATLPPAPRRADPKRRVVAYAPTYNVASPLDDCLKGRWVHDETVSRKQDLVRLLQTDDPQVGDFGVLQNPPGSDLFGILVVVFSVDGQIKARKTEIVRLADEGRCVSFVRSNRAAVF